MLFDAFLVGVGLVLGWFFLPAPKFMQDFYNNHFGSK